jgi:hypothetical protein
MNSVEALKGFGALRSRTRLGTFLGHVVFNDESLNGPKIALNIMNEGKNSLNGKCKYLLHSIQNSFKNSKNLNPSPTGDGDGSTQNVF